MPPPATPLCPPARRFEEAAPEASCAAVMLPLAILLDVIAPSSTVPASSA
jgi:hypothetical protein